MESQEFIEKVYGPYGDAWKAVKILAMAEDDNPALDDVLHRYMGEVESFKEKYEGNKFAELLYGMLLTADDTIMGMNQ